jgi:hypothetical protein
VPLIALNERQPVYLRSDTHWNRLDAPGVIGDEDARIDLAPYGLVPLRTEALDTHKAETSGTVTQTGRDGPNIVVLGDSFTEQAWRGYFSLHAARFAWIHNELCDFDPGVVEAQKPDIVILAPTERLMFCWNRKL